MKKMLYLDGPREHVVFPDGPSIIVKANGKAIRRFPLRYLAGIEARGNSLWSTTAIQLLLQSSIPINFRAPDGTILGFAHAVTENRSSLAERLVQAQLYPGFDSLYKVWFAAFERRQILRTARLLRCRIGDLRPRQAEMFLENRLRAAYPELPLESLLLEFRSGQRVESAVFLLAQGFDSRFLRPLNGDTCFSDDLASLALWNDWPLLFRACSRASMTGREAESVQLLLRSHREAVRQQSNHWRLQVLSQLGDMMWGYGL